MVVFVVNGITLAFCGTPQVVQYYSVQLHLFETVVTHLAIQLNYTPEKSFHFTILTAPQSIEQ